MNETIKFCENEKCEVCPWAKKVLENVEEISANDANALIIAAEIADKIYNKENNNRKKIIRIENDKKFTLFYAAKNGQRICCLMNKKDKKNRKKYINAFFKGKLCINSV